MESPLQWGMVNSTNRAILGIGEIDRSTADPKYFIVVLPAGVTVVSNSVRITTNLNVGKLASLGGVVVTNGLTNLTLTASTLMVADANQKETSIANGTGFLTNNNAGGFGWFPYSGLPSGGSTPNGLVTNLAGANIVVTNAGVNTTITSNSVTTTTVTASAANVGGFGVATTNQLVSYAGVTQTNQYFMTDATTNPITTLNGNMWTNVMGTNIVLDTGTLAPTSNATNYSSWLTAVPGSHIIYPANTNVFLSLTGTNLPDVTRTLFVDNSTGAVNCNLIFNFSYRTNQQFTAVVSNGWDGVFTLCTVRTSGVVRIFDAGRTH
jgi:hypothetical protein